MADILPALYVDTDLFHLPVVGFLDEFYTPAIAATYAVSSALYSDADSFFTQLAAVGTVDLAPPLYSDDESFYTALISQDGALVLAPDLCSDTDEFFTPALGGSVVLSPALYSDSDSFFTHTLSYSLTAILYDDTESFYIQVIAAGAVVLLPSLFVDEDNFFTQTVGSAAWGLGSPIEVALFGAPGLRGRMSFPRLFGGFGLWGGPLDAGVAPGIPNVNDTTGYRPAPISEAPPGNIHGAASEKWVRRIVDVVNRSQSGKLNVTLNVTLTANASSTTIVDARISAFSALMLMPLTANAAAEQAAGGLYVGAQQSGQATIEHANNAQGDRTFRMVILA